MRSQIYNLFSGKTANLFQHKFSENYVLQYIKYFVKYG